MTYTEQALNNRKTEYSCHPLLLQRWSSRAFSKNLISNDELYSLFEAARWAPSSYNTQPWKFYVVHKESASWNLLFDALVEFNQQWCKNASALILVTSRKQRDGKDLPTASLDTGSAMQNLLLQASSLGLVAHAMSGFDYEKARKNLNLADDIIVQAMIAVGHYGGTDVLPDSLHGGEMPSSRNDFSDFVTEL